MLRRGVVASSNMGAAALLRAPFDLNAIKNSWGDIVLSWSDKKVGRTYQVDILNPADHSVVRTIETSGISVGPERYQCDYPIEMSVVDFGFEPSYVEFQVRIKDTTIVSPRWSNAPAIDNASIVQFTVAFGGQSNSFGHFSSLSGADKSTQSAGTLRRKIAELKGLRDVQVMPVLVAWGSSAADRQADDDPTAGTNYWWDLGDAAYNVNLPGPRTTQLISTIQGLGVTLDALVWAQGENDAGAMDPLSAPRSSSKQRYQDATQRVFEKIRADLSLPSLPIYIQTIGRGWVGDAPNQTEVAGIHYKSVRDAQRTLATTMTNVRIGSWTPGVEKISGYVGEGTGSGTNWVHYTSSVYQATSLELASAIHLGTNRVSTPPAWVDMVVPSNVILSMVGQDMEIYWDGDVAKTYKVMSRHVGTGAVAQTYTVTGPFVLYPYADMVTNYGFGTTYFSGTIAEYDSVNDVYGPAADVVGQASLLYLHSTSLGTSGAFSYEVNNNINLKTKGGLVWVKSRNTVESHYLYDDMQVITRLSTDTTAPAITVPPGITMRTRGFTINAVWPETAQLVSWSFRRQNNFFTRKILSHTNGTNSVLDLSELGTVGFVIWKSLTETGNWKAIHKSLPTSDFNFNLNEAYAATIHSLVGTTLTVNASTPSGAYMVYAWADNPDLVRCGSAAPGATVSLGWPYRFLLMKIANSASPWKVYDHQRINMETSSIYGLDVSSSGTEAPLALMTPTADGFTVASTGSDVVYVAVR